MKKHYLIAASIIALGTISTLSTQVSAKTTITYKAKTSRVWQYKNLPNTKKAKAHVNKKYKLKGKLTAKAFQTIKGAKYVALAKNGKVLGWFKVSQLSPVVSKTAAKATKAKATKTSATQQKLTSDDSDSSTDDSSTIQSSSAATDTTTTDTTTTQSSQTNTTSSDQTATTTATTTATQSPSVSTTTYQGAASNNPTSNVLAAMNQSTSNWDGHHRSDRCRPSSADFFEPVPGKRWINPAFD